MHVECGYIPIKFQYGFHEIAERLKQRGAVL